MDETDLEKAMHLLIHDVRAPLSVAQGYVRLLKEDRLGSGEDRQRALEQTMEALGRIGRLCEDASAYVAPRDDPRRATVKVSAFVNRVSEACGRRCPDRISVGPEGNDSGPLDGMVLDGAVHLVAESVAIILCAVCRSAKAGSARVAVVGGQGEVRFLLGTDEGRTSLVSGPLEAFDPWRGGHGIALPLACRTVTEAGGRIWTFNDGQGAVAVALPEEVPVS